MWWVLFHFQMIRQRLPYHWIRGCHILEMTLTMTMIAPLMILLQEVVVEVPLSPVLGSPNENYGLLLRRLGSPILLGMLIMVS